MYHLLGFTYTAYMEPLYRQQKESYTLYHLLSSTHPIQCWFLWNACLSSTLYLWVLFPLFWYCRYFLPPSFSPLLRFNHDYHDYQTLSCLNLKKHPLGCQSAIGYQAPNIWKDIISIERICNRLVIFKRLYSYLFF